MLLVSLKKSGRRRADFAFCIGDRPEDAPSLNLPTFAYSSSIESISRGIICAPDFLFMGWPESGIADYAETSISCAQASESPPAHASAFWVGNPETNVARKKALQALTGSAQFTLLKTDWLNLDQSNYVSLADHADYSVLLDFPAHGWSARLKLLLWTGCPVVILKSKYSEFYYPFLQHKYNCLIVGSLRELRSSVSALLADRDLAQQIGLRGLSLAREHLTREAALAFMTQQIAALP